MSPSSKGPEQEPKGKKVEAAKTPELDTLLGSLSRLRSAIHGDEPIHVDQLHQIGSQVQAVKPDYKNVDGFLQSNEDDPNVSVWKEIADGKKEGIHMLTKLPAEVVKCVPSAFLWECPKLQKLETDTAEALVEKGHSITIGAGTELAPGVVDILSASHALRVISDDKKNDLITINVSDLTPEWAKALMVIANSKINHKSRGRTTIPDLTLPNVKTLSPEAARALDNSGIEWHWSSVTLPSLTSIGMATAEALKARATPQKILLGCNTVPDSRETAQLLLQNPKVMTDTENGTLVFNAEVKPEPWVVAYHLRKTEKPAWSVEFKNLKTVDPSITEGLKGFEGAVHFSGVTSLDTKSASALAGLPIRGLFLKNMKELPPDVAVSLGAYRGETLDLSALETLSTETAKHLSKYRGNLVLNGLKTLTAPQEPTSSYQMVMQKIFGEGPKGPSYLLRNSQAKHLSLDGLTAISGQEAEALTSVSHLKGRKQDVSLRDLKEVLDEDAATVLTNYLASFDKAKTAYEEANPLYGSGPKAPFTGWKEFDYLTYEFKSMIKNIAHKAAERKRLASLAKNLPQ